MDWKTLISDLQARGMSQAAIGAALNRSQTWVADIVRGRYRDIPWGEGEALRQLHRKMTDGRRRQPAGPVARAKKVSPKAISDRG